MFYENVILFFKSEGEFYLKKGMKEYSFNNASLLKPLQEAYSYL